MQYELHASHGAGALGAPRALAWGDARSSIRLFGSCAGVRGGTALLEDPGDPISAARAWLADPARRGVLTPELRHVASQCIDVAASHLRELDLLAGELAREANETGAIDPLRLDRLDVMASLLRAWADRMRLALDPGTGTDPQELETRLRVAVESARTNGLPALVAAL